MSTHEKSELISDQELLDILEADDGFVVFNKGLSIIYFNEVAIDYFAIKFGEEVTEEIKELYELKDKPQIFKFLTDYLYRLEQKQFKLIKEVDNFYYNGELQSYEISVYEAKQKRKVIQLHNVQQVTDNEVYEKKRTATKNVAINFFQFFISVVLVISGGLSYLDRKTDAQENAKNQEIILKTLSEMNSQKKVHDLTIELIESRASEKSAKKNESIAYLLLNGAFGDTSNVQSLLDSMYWVSEKYNQQIKQIQSRLPDSLRNRVGQE